MKEKRVLEGQIKVKDKEVEKLNKQLDQILSDTGYVKGQPQKEPFKDIKNNENRIGELQLMVQKLEEEQRTSKQIQRKKTQLIETLSKELDTKKHVEEELYQAQNLIKVKDRDVKDLTDELKMLKRLDGKKDKQIICLRNEKDDIPIKKLEGDKRFLQSEIAKHLEIRRQQERTIKAQQYRIDQLEARLESVTTALKDLKLDNHMGDPSKGKIVPKDSSHKNLGDINQIVPEKETIDIKMYEVLQQDLDQLRNALGLKEVIIQEKDQNVEALEKKVEILAHAKRTEGRVVSAERKELAIQIEDLKCALGIQHDENRIQMDKLKKENAALKKKVRELQV
eukprot:NODE_639_length_1478_cov_259.118964_g476_i0.p1 GENE.NODE_639_length_1478_cov_259.118964_g476_i0~~NODE_639_length_1478_cov_259.118964_g476_i0.p1  ORF type:complete len:338 (-),score=93.47 NODE_639_length_1478_cov_259.118964_g476_i0:101-1114(-)